MSPNFCPTHHFPPHWTIPTRLTHIVHITNNLPSMPMSPTINYFLSESSSNNPQAWMTTRSLGLPEALPHCSIISTTGQPSITEPKTTCLPSRWGVRLVVIKNWLPFVWRPALAILKVDRNKRRVLRRKMKKHLQSHAVRHVPMDSTPGPTCWSWKFSSGKRPSVAVP